ncbi:polysaccharide deacetylase family protein [uncultured Tateyamaria sp.]|uniref:polysaccharide deacetylase family protein n=1 Tax=uncultured Tateyamaria sp. TaxID=455651 RepID=UPI0026089AF5|nr:polysaccharide deacetylase family protein [uncultured Tateyamaria sp.]
MTADWAPLRAALARLRSDGIALPVWWRDDDAISATPTLDRLMAASAQARIPVHLAIIPAHVDDTLVDRLDPDILIPVVHGWAHQDHSGGVGKKNEFLTPRSDAQADASRAIDRMRDIFGADLRAMFVPPWNRIGAEVVEALAAQGYTALSTFGPRIDVQAAPGLAQINTHIDPIWWKGSRDLVDPEQLIAQACQHLDARRTGAEDSTEPFGLLTHHLVHTEAIWTFSAAFLHELLDGGAAPWTMESETHEQT